VEALDGNAIGGALFEAFGSEMTAAIGKCRFCGAVGPIAGLRVYMRAPGAVARCAVCMNVVMVVVTIRGTTAAELPGLDLYRAGS
jgi:Family of unknown function (DUF6510)